MDPVTTPSRTEYGAITAAATRFRRSRGLSDLLAASRLVVGQGRVLEAAYGVYCFAVHPPGRLASPVDNFDPAAAAVAGRVALAELVAEKSERRRTILRDMASGETELDCRLHGFARAGSKLVFGEYAERSARLFVHDGSRVSVIAPYQNDPAVRHIHSLLLHGDLLYVTTGDAGKYLDRYQWVDGELRFDTRVLRHFGGFTTCAVVGGRTWFGSDFSERPNYLYCLETGKKRFFPRPAYTMWCLVMLPLADRYLYCVNTRLDSVSDRRAVSIFDTRLGRFVSSTEVERNDLPV